MCSSTSRCGAPLLTKWERKVAGEVDVPEDDGTTLMIKYFNFHVVYLEECVGWVSLLVANTFTRAARERWAVCKAYGKDNKIY